MKIDVDADLIGMIKGLWLTFIGVVASTAVFIYRGSVVEKTVKKHEKILDDCVLKDACSKTMDKFAATCDKNMRAFKEIRAEDQRTQKEVFKYFKGEIETLHNKTDQNFKDMTQEIKELIKEMK